jgi:hypothetical protein
MRSGGGTGAQIWESHEHENPLRVSLALLTACGGMLTPGCGEDEIVSAAECILAAKVVFHGREYAEGEVVGLSERQIERGPRLGVGEMVACPGDERNASRSSRSSAFLCSEPCTSSRTARWCARAPTRTDLPRPLMPLCLRSGRVPSAGESEASALRWMT